MTGVQTCALPIWAGSGGHVTALAGQEGGTGEEGWETEDQGCQGDDSLRSDEPGWERSLLQQSQPHLRKRGEVRRDVGRRRMDPAVRGRI